MKTEKTLRPWKYVPKTSIRYDSFNGNKSETTEHWIRAEDDSFICIMGTITPDRDAELIVKAVNSYDELVQSLENFISELVDMKEDHVRVERYRDILKRAKGEV